MAFSQPKYGVRDGVRQIEFIVNKIKEVQLAPANVCEQRAYRR